MRQRQAAPLEVIVSEIRVDPQLVGYCGIYCGACPRLIKGGCPGCHDNDKATWCKVRSCCIEAQYSSCADCGDNSDPRECRKFHNLFSRVIGFVLRSDRRACVFQIKELGIDGHAKAMAELGRPSIRP
jgi:hypothetical protein